jgi:hypothetical protein
MSSIIEGYNYDTCLPAGRCHQLPYGLLLLVQLKILAASSKESSIPNKEFFVYAR